MIELTLEKSFEFYKLQHMYDVLFIKMTNHYRDLQNTGVTLPDFMQKKPEDLAQQELNNVLANVDKNVFYELYEKAYQELALIDEV